MRILIVIVSLVFVVATSGLGSAQRVSTEERQAIKEIKSQIDVAGRKFKARKAPESIQAWTDARDQLFQLAKGARPELVSALKTEYGRLLKIRRWLTEAGEEVPELPSFDDATKPAAKAVSFLKDVAPIIVTKCGNCHVNQSRGRFSAATFEALEKSTTIAFGIPRDSRLIQLIEQGEMPKGGLKVSESELETLKAWITQGAKFDGQDRRQNLNQLVNRGRRQMDPELAVAKPTGKETVSFGLHVAPILVEHCARCHMVDNPRGNFFQATFESFLRGGDSGAPIKPGDAEASVLFGRISAGEMPPNGRLPKDAIELIRKWIEEGAKFDGLDASATLDTVAKTAKAGSQSHVELQQDRLKLSLSHWELVMDNAAPVQVVSKNFNVFSSADDARTQAVSEMLEKLMPKLATVFKTDANTPLVKGNLSVFIFDKRYDFSEFGKMVSQQEIPKEQTYFWDYNIRDAFASVLLTRNQTAADSEIVLMQQVAAVYMASLAPDIPRWFSDGTGYWVAASHASKNDLVKAWEAASVGAARSLTTPADLLEGRISGRDAGLVGYQVIKTLKKRSSSFNRMLASLRNKESFAQAFEGAFGAPLEVYLERGW
jgi:mono/diheme cytochrome c family protein